MFHGVSAVKFYDVCLKHRWWLLALTLAVWVGSLAVAATAAQAAGAPAQMPPPKLIPEKIEMGAFYDGSRLRIEGTAPDGAGVLVVIRGDRKDEFFNRKGRVGPIWLNVDRIHIQQAPSVFLSFASTDAGSLLDRASLDEYRLDEAAIMKRIHCLCHCKCSLTNRAQQSGARDTQPDPAYAKLLQSDFFHLKEREGCYSVRPHTVSLSAAASGTAYALDFEWPRMAPPGDYQVEVYACRGQRVVARSATTLRFVEVGFPAYMANLASQRPWTYGAGAVLVAMLAGFLTDVLASMLRRKRRSHAKSGPSAGGTPEAPHEEPAVETHEAETIHKD